MPINVCCPITRDLKSAIWLSSSSIPQQAEEEEKIESAKEKTVNLSAYVQATAVEAFNDLKAGRPFNPRHLSILKDEYRRANGLQPFEAADSNSQQQREDAKEKVKDEVKDASEIVVNDDEEVEVDLTPTAARVMALQRWVVFGVLDDDAKIDSQISRHMLAERQLITMPSKQVYDLEYKYSVLEPEMAKQILLSNGLHRCDKLAGVKEEVKRQEIIKEARDIVHLKVQIYADARARGFRNVGIFVDGEIHIVGIHDAVIDCMCCGQTAKSPCYQCNYWYCIPCLTEHTRRRNVGCRCNRPVCNPCKYQSRRNHPVHSLKRTRVCNNIGADLRCHLIPYGKATLNSKDAPSHGYCPGCGVFFYCSRKCQKQHWHKGGHKQECALWAAWRLKYKDITKQNSRFKEDTSSRK